MDVTWKAKVRVPTQPQAGTNKEVTPLYAESINMLDGMADEEVDRYLEEHPRIVPLFEVYVAKAVQTDKCGKRKGTGRKFDNGGIH
mgnify:CR=1 FL=1